MKRIVMVFLLPVFLHACAPKKEESALSPLQVVFAWEKAATVRREHRLLSLFAGQWRTLTRFWYDPSQPPQESVGVVEAALIMGGRFLEERYQGAPMGRQVEGRAITGFNNLTRKYESIWFDNTSTSIAMAFGTSDEKGTRFEYHGSYLDPVTGEKKENRSVLRVLSDDQRVFEMYEISSAGKEYKALEIEYTRASLGR